MFQIERTICNVIQSDRFWNDLSDIVTVFEPCLYVLRLADLQSPAMDQLYFYVRRTDALMDLLKEQLNQMEEKYIKQQAPNFLSKMMNYFLRSKEKIDFRSIISNVDKNLLKDIDDDSSVESMEDLEDDMESIDGSDVDDSEDNRCGTFFEHFWKRRSVALRTDIAIAGWMCSPNAEIMEDCSTNHTGEHKDAVTRLLTKWFGHEVSNFPSFVSSKKI